MTVVLLDFQSTSGAPDTIVCFLSFNKVTVTTGLLFWQSSRGGPDTVVTLKLQGNKGGDDLAILTIEQRCRSCCCHYWSFRSVNGTAGLHFRQRSAARQILFSILKLQGGNSDDSFALLTIEQRCAWYCWHFSVESEFSLEWSFKFWICAVDQGVGLWYPVRTPYSFAVLGIINRYGVGEGGRGGETDCAIIPPHYWRKGEVWG